MNRIFVFFIIVFIINDIYSQILVPSVISTNTILDNKENYYYSNGNISVSAGITLTISEGVELRMTDGAIIGVSGSLICNGQEDEPIIINAINPGSKWNRISASNAFVYLSHVKIFNAVQFIAASYSGVNLFNCYVDSTFGGIGYDCIALHDVDSVIMKYCELHGDPSKSRIDAIDCDATTRGIFKHNKIFDFEDDGFDIGTGATNVIIDSNYIVNCNFGISVGENSVVSAYGNTIVSCDGALQSHTGSTLNVNHCTFYNNGKGVECHHASNTNSYGNAFIKNTIFSQTSGSIFTIQQGANISIQYSISDTDIINSDTTNLFGDPLFMYPDTGNFNLQASSPCIDAGDPYERYDVCCHRTDLGAHEAYCGEPDPECEEPPPPPPPPPPPTLLVFNEKEIQVTLYPNPFRDKICIGHNNYESGEYLFKLTDSNGKIIFEQIITGKEECIFVSGVPPGIYFFHMIDLNNNIIITAQKIFRH